MPPRLRRYAPRSQLYGRAGIVGKERIVDLDDRGFRDGDLQVAQKRRRDPFVDKDAPVLRIVLKFDDVEPAVVRFQQVRLRASPHPADQTPGADGHRARLPTATSFPSLRLSLREPSSRPFWQGLSSPPS